MKYWIIGLLIFVLSTYLRFTQFTNRAPFDWDQNRDYGEVIKIASGHYVPLGPVAKGTGGFYLGSLYYYLLTPGYLLTHGNLASLPATSIALDCLVILCLLMLFPRVIGKRGAIALVLLWGSSWFLIEASKISWNVALLPLWTLFTLYAFQNLLNERSPKYLALLGLLAGLSFHVHVTTIPLIPILLLLHSRRLKFKATDWLNAIVFTTIPLIPLLLYDLTHYWENLHLAKAVFSTSIRVNTPLLDMVIMALTKLGKVVSGIFLNHFADSFILGLTTLMIAFKSLFTKNSMFRLAGLFTLITTFLIIAFRDYNFPEYYFTAAYLPIFLLYFYTFTELFTKRLIIIPLSILAILLAINLRGFTTSPTGFSLSNKAEFIASLSEIPGPIDLHYAFDPGRDGGLRYLVAQNHLPLKPTSRTRVLLTDKLNTPLYIEGELTHDIKQLGNLRSAIYIVQ